ncbi:hypothetical protein ACFQY7_40640 [Actinomadura luteofluorescens]|uniref:hypothetical protein n=1 Tax=Actinomadura luteofluorescens TaxID=46163 RepID=UPI00362DEE29
MLREGGRLAVTCWVMPGSGALAIVREAIVAAGVPWPDDIPEPPFLEYGEPRRSGGWSSRPGSPRSRSRR